ncbi:hypothetical protein FOZ62_017721 [Perkinsus olseni]|uniref:Cytoplasmic dynein 2 light intermediate chain 1 n=2 Tax=Perkinsus olseni TaxID=32597 RepID=A0A7J6UBP3_PEROL|nr:hypothetical protein FOZ62_017721 [Perkinsus olseni]
MPAELLEKTAPAEEKTTAAAAEPAAAEEQPVDPKLLPSAQTIAQPAGFVLEAQKKEAAAQQAAAAAAASNMEEHQQQQQLIWDKLIQDYLDSRHAARTTAAVFLGSKGSGKTSLIHKYLKLKAHLFDVGPSRTAWQLFEPISQRFNNIVVVVVVDLSQPSNIYSGAMDGLRVAHKILSKVSHSTAAAPRILLAATKQDQLSEIMDPNHARRLLDALRSICNHQQASLISLSLRSGDGGLKTFTSFLRANLFPTASAIPLIPQLLSNCSDYSKPLAISFGTDRLEGIEEPYGGWEVNLSKTFPTTKPSPPIDEEQQAGTGLEPRVAAIVEKEKAQLLRKELAAAACS